VRERERGVQKVSQIQKVRAVLGDVYLPGADRAQRTDEGEKAMMGWIYFAGEMAPGRILVAELVSPCCHDHIPVPLARNLANYADPLQSTNLPGFFAKYPRQYWVSTFFATVGRHSLLLCRDKGPRVRGVLLVHCCAEHVGHHVCSAERWSRSPTKDVDITPND